MRFPTLTLANAMTARIPRALAGLSAAALGVMCLSTAASAIPSTGSTIGGDELRLPGPIVHYLAGATGLPVVKAQSWVVADITTGQILAAHNAHIRLRPASTLKTLTSLTVLDAVDLATIYRAAPSDSSAGGSRVGVVANATYTVKDLLHGLLLPSGNDAASSLAHAYGGWHKTVNAMNAKARQLQALDTHAINPSGLDADGQYSSAYDLTLFARAALANSTFRAISGSKSYLFPGVINAKTGKRSAYRIYSENRLLLHGYKGTIAGKTGFTSKAGRTFWGAATRSGHTLVVALMKIDGPTETAAKALLTWGFRNRTHVRPVGVLVDPVSVTTQVDAGTGAASGGEVSAIYGPRGGSDGGMPFALTLLGASAIGVTAIYWRRRTKPPSTFDEKEVTTSEG